MGLSTWNTCYNINVLHQHQEDTTCDFKAHLHAVDTHIEPVNDGPNRCQMPVSNLRACRHAKQASATWRYHLDICPVAVTSVACTLVWTSRSRAGSLRFQCVHSANKHHHHYQWNHTVCQAFSASLKRSLNLSANKHYYYISFGVQGSGFRVLGFRVWLLSFI